MGYDLATTMDATAGQSEPRRAAETCPKCGWTPGPAWLPSSGCARCGLLRERWSGFRAEAGASTGMLDTAWERCLAAWDDPAAHDRLRDLAVTAGALPDLAGRYRSRLDADAGDAVASAQLGRIALLAETVLKSQLKEPEERSFQIARFVKYVAVGMFVGACAWITVRLLTGHG